MGQSRYARQIVLPEIGAAGQEQLGRQSVLILGCGALGCVLATYVVRAGVGRVVIADRDFIEFDNLQRQILFDETDIERGLPKAVAAAERLARANSDILIEPVVADVNRSNIEALVDGVGLVLDGTDNFETRLLLNDVCVKLGRPWVYGGVIGTHGMTMAIVPGETACLRCLLEVVPDPGVLPTCETAGVLGPAVGVIASLQAVEALKLLTGQDNMLHRDLLYVDVWTGSFERIEVGKRPDCPACNGRSFEFLDGRAGSVLTALCGRDAYQVNVQGRGRPAFAPMAERLAQLGDVRYNDHMLRFEVGDQQITLFADGRAIVNGAASQAAARSFYSRYVGN